MMHVKTLLFDNEIVLTGSVNMTHNGHENNKEHMYRITEPSAVAAVIADFEADWVAATPVDGKMIRTMNEIRRERKQKNKEASKTSGNADPGKGVRRALSLELDKVKK